MKLLPKDKIGFGKNRGLELGIIYQYEPGYIEWLIKNVIEFSISIEHFESLPNPKPIDNYKVLLTPEEQEKNRSFLKEFLEKNQIPKLEKLFLELNANGQKSFPTTVAQAMEMEKLGFIIKEFEYKFPQEIRIFNDKKP